MNVEDTIRDMIDKIEPPIDMEECEMCGESYIAGEEFSGRVSYLEYDEDSKKPEYKHKDICPECIKSLMKG